MDLSGYTTSRDKAARPQEIVLLEDSDLYQYHQQQHLQQQQLSTTPDRHVTGEYDGSYQPQHHYARSVPTRAAASFLPTSELGSERQYQRHAHTPYGAASSVRKPSMTSIDTIPLTHGALRPGGAVDLFSRQYIGLLLNWSLVGFFNGSLSSIVFPFVGVFLGYTDYQTNAASTLLNVPWLFKFLAGFLSDCFPIKRQRRKPYIYIGWTAFLLFMVAMTLLNEPVSFKESKDAAIQGPKYVIMLMFGSLGHLISTVAVEGMMIEFAQREGEFARGRTQCWCIIFRFIGEAIGAFSVSLAINSAAFGGTFAAAVPMRVIFGAHVVLAGLGLVITKFLLIEDLTSTSSQHVTSQLRRIWNIMQKRTTWQITLFGFFAKIGTNYEIPGHNSIVTKWLSAKTIVVNINDAIGSLGYIIAAALFMKLLLNTNWRKLYVCVMAIGLVVMIPVDIVTVFNVERSLPLYLSKAQIVSILDAFVFILRLVVIVEVAEPGYEAVTYGVLTTVFNLGSTVTSMCKNVIASRWTEAETSTAIDSSEVRWHYMRAYLFKYGLRVFIVLLLLRLLPRQKRHLKELNMRGAPNLVIPIVLFVLFAGLFVASVTSNMLALFESTACLLFAGGGGC